MRAPIGGRGDQSGVRAADARDEKVSEMADGFAAEMLQVLSLRKQPMHERKNALRRTRFDGAGQLIENFFGDDAEQLATCPSVISAPQ